MSLRLKIPTRAVVVLALAVGALLPTRPLAGAQAARELADEPEGPSPRELPVTSVGPVSFVMDTGVFYSEEGTPVVEVYLQASYDELPFIRRSGGYVSRLEVVVVFLSRSGEQVGGDTWNREVWVKRYDDTIDPEKKYRAVARFAVPSGEYDLKVTCGGVGSNLNGEAHARVSVPKSPSEGLYLSDMRMGECGGGEGENVPFVPSADRSFGIETPVICVQAEVGARGAADAESLAVEASAVDYEGRTVWENRLSVARTGGRTPLAFRVPIDSLGWGEYKLSLDVRAGGHEAKADRWFEADETRIGLAMNPDLFMDLLSLVATDEELETYASLGGSEQKAYLDEIWRKRDPDRSTPRNEFKVRFFRRIKYAKSHYAEPGREGWQTDRGRVFVENGPPDRIDTRQGVIGSLSPQAVLEVWYYDATNTHYVFEDYGGTGQFTLVDVVQG